MTSAPKKAMVLAAGRGARLWPLTDEKPKALLEVAGRPMIEYPLRMLARAGVGEVIVNLHHQGDAIRAALGQGERFGLTIRYSEEEPVLDTGGAIARVRPLLEDRPFVVVNCDTILDVDLDALAGFHGERGAVATLVLREDPAVERYGAIDIDRRGQIRRFLGRPPEAAGPLERYMFCGVHLLSPAIFEHMPASGVFSITRDVYAPTVEAAGVSLFGFAYAGYWHDLGTHEAIEAATRDLESGRFRPSYLDVGSAHR